MLSDMSEFWAAVDVLAVPSRFEPFGMVVTEAAVREIPVVVTPEVGAADLVRTHTAGEVASLDVLADALCRVQRDPTRFLHGSRSLARHVAAEGLAQDLIAHWDRAYARGR